MISSESSGSFVEKIVEIKTKTNNKDFFFVKKKKKYKNDDKSMYLLICTIKFFF